MKIYFQKNLSYITYNQMISQENHMNIYVADFYTMKLNAKCSMV